MHPLYKILSLCVVFFCNNFLVVSSDPLESDKSFFWLSHSSEKIVGGAPCNPYHQVSLQATRGSHFCGGSIFSSNCIISAAHCVSGSSAHSIKVKCGAHSLNSPNMVSYRVTTIKSHPNYNSDTIDNDVALIKIDGAIPLGSNSSLGKVSLPQNDTKLVAGTIVTTSGYGTTSESGSSSTQCMCVDVPVVASDSCNKSYSNKITDGMVCAGTEGKDSCQGDSGGPLVDSNNVLVGIVSWGYGCARNGYPGVYTDVGHYLPWITKTATEMGCNMSSS